MHTNDLELFSTRELIDELLRRKTFLGVVVHAAEEYRSHDWAQDQTFSVHYNSNLTKDEVARLLDVVAARVQLHE